MLVMQQVFNELDTDNERKKQKIQVDMTEKYRDLVFVTRAIKNGVTPKIKEDLPI